MSIATTDQTFYRAAYNATVIFIVVGIISMFFPLYPPVGTLESKAQWLLENRSIFVTSWGLQIILMTVVAISIGGAAWSFYKEKPIRAALTWLFLFISVIAFLIPKFFAVWAIPQLAVAALEGGKHSDLAYQMLGQLETSEISFSMFTTYDYLGFLMYAFSGLLIAAPLFKDGQVSAKIAAVGLGLYGLIFSATTFVVMFDVAKDVDIHAAAEYLNGLLIVSLFALVVFFRQKKSQQYSASLAQA